MLLGEAQTAELVDEPAADHLDAAGEILVGDAELVVLPAERRCLVAGVGEVREADLEAGDHLLVLEREAGEALAALCGGGGGRVVPVIDDGAGVGGAAGERGGARRRREERAAEAEGGRGGGVAVEEIPAVGEKAGRGEAWISEAAGLLGPERRMQAVGLGRSEDHFHDGASALLSFVFPPQTTCPCNQIGSKRQGKIQGKSREIYLCSENHCRKHPRSILLEAMAEQN